MTMQQTIQAKLSAAINVSHLEVENESHNHSVPPGSESHFKVTLVSDDFNAVRSVARHQQVYKILAEELANGVHALALHTYTSVEWQAKSKAPDSPDCKGGSKRD
jgi:BolA protein